jgi:hypothetical protein
MMEKLSENASLMNALIELSEIYKVKNDDPVPKGIFLALIKTKTMIIIMIFHFFKKVPTMSMVVVI